MTEFRTVTPVRPAAAYIGGKKRLAERIARRIEAVPHELYAEPFVGMGGIFFRRQVAAKVEVVNDVSRDVATLFRILQRHYPQFMETLKFQIASRREFERLLACNPATLTDLERAARFLYLQRLTFGGKVAGRSFGVDLGGASRFDLTKLGAILEAIHERLAGVTIECLSWREFIPRYDSPRTLFYLDPPYWGSEDDYGSGVFAPSDFARLAQLLEGIKGRFILSVNDLPATRVVFQAFAIEAISTRYTIAGGEWSEAAEILVTGPGADPGAFPQPREPIFELWSIVLGIAPPIPGCGQRNVGVPGELISLANAHALFRGIERPLAEDDDGSGVLAYILKPAFMYGYDANSMVSVALKVAVPQDVVFVVYVRLDKVGIGVVGTVTHWSFVDADERDPTLPVDFSTRYRTRLW